MSEKSALNHDGLNIRLGDQKTIVPSRYCVITFSLDGDLNIRGTDADVESIMKDLHDAGFAIRWDYASPCG